MAKRIVYTVEYLSEILIENKKEPIREQFLLNSSDDSIDEVNISANNVHLENIKKASQNYPNNFIEHSLKKINISKTELSKYKFTSI